MRPDHTLEMVRLLGSSVCGDIHGLPDSRLAVRPETTHVSLLDRSDWLAPMIHEFLG